MSEKRRGPLVIAHRGASGYAPEHTFEAYDLALALGADVLELDLRLTADGALAVVHDRTLWRTHGDSREVAQMTVGELDELTDPGPPLRLDQVFERYGGAARYLLDLKEPRRPLERRVTEVVAHSGLADLVQVQTFSRAGLRRTHRSSPALSFSQLYGSGPADGAILRDLDRVSRFADAIGPEVASVDAGLVAETHRRGLRVQPYTVNDPAEIERLVGLGVDALITDVPDVARAAAV